MAQLEATVGEFSEVQVGLSESVLQKSLVTASSIRLW